jgi:hypothetical protein
MATMDALHDTAGNVALIGTLFGVGLFALGLNQTDSISSPLPSPVATRQKIAPSCRIVIFTSICLLFIGEITIQLGYKSGDLADAKFRVSLNRPLGWDTTEVNASAQEILSYTSAQGLSFRDPVRATSWLMFVFNWSGDISEIGGFEHDPASCLPGSGSILDAKRGTSPFQIGPRKIELEWYRFITRSGRTQHVFYQVFDGFSGRPINPQSDSRSITEFRLNLVRQARSTPNRVQTTFGREGIVLDDGAQAAMRAKLSEILEFNASGS